MANVREWCTVDGDNQPPAFEDVDVLVAWEGGTTQILRAWCSTPEFWYNAASFYRIPGTVTRWRPLP
jgi:hypothetical protein